MRIAQVLMWVVVLMLYGEAYWSTQLEIKLKKIVRSDRQNCVTSEESLSMRPRSLLECGVLCSSQFDGICQVMTYSKRNMSCSIISMTNDFYFHFESECASYMMKSKKELDGHLPILNNVTRGIVPAPSISNWMIVQQRVDNTLSFQQNWEAYKQGFGNPSSNFWLGLEALRAFIARNSLSLRLEVLAENVWYADMYSTFVLKDESQGYRIQVKGHYGDNGDVFKVAPSPKQAIFNSQFSTFDRDNDKQKSGTCAVDSGWWFNDCASFNLNAPYDKPAEFRYYLVKTKSPVAITTCRMLILVN